MMKELVVAEKEFKEYIMGRRFIAVFAILFILCIVGMVSGIQQYNTQLDYYKDQQQQRQTDPGYQSMMMDMQRQLADMKANGAPQDQIDSMEASLENQDTSNMPSLLTIFYSVMSPFYMVGMALAASIGFDMISKEKEEGSLKSLLSHPIFRDSIINGKAIAAVALLVVTLAATFLVVMAVLLLYGVVPAGDDLARVLALFVVTLLYCIVFLAISIMISTLVKSSTMSILIILGIFLVSYSLPSISYSIANFVVGPQPEQPMNNYWIQVPPNGTVTINGHTYTAEEANRINQENQQLNQVQQQEYQNKSRDYWKKTGEVSSFVNIVSPMNDYQVMGSAILSNQKQTEPFFIGPYRPEKVTLWESLSYEWGSLVALIVMGFAAFAVSYAAFMRTDVR